MMETGPGSRRANPAAGPVFVDYTAVESMQANSEAAGWQIEYRQLDAGRLRSRTTFLECEDVSFMRESANRRLNVVASAPPEAVTIAMSASSAGFRANGIDVSDGTVLLVPPGADFDAISEPGVDALSVHISARRFHDNLVAARSVHDPTVLGRVRGIRLDPRIIHRIRALIASATGSRQSMFPLSDEMHVLDALIAGVAVGAPGTTDRHAPHRITRKRNILAKTMGFIDANLGKSLRIADLCAVAGVSVSTLERLFRSELHMSPLAYIRARRLDAVRRALKRSDPATPISELAYFCGFSHMGRFARDYRLQFGLLPSEDRLLS